MNRVIIFFTRAAGCAVLGSFCLCNLNADDALAQQSVTFSGELDQKRDFIRAFGSRFAFVLKPIDHGWVIQIRDERGTEVISRFTPPWHFVPNPRYIEGWHFRNSDNSGPNEPDSKNVNAPQTIREFIFSPEVGRTIGGPEARRHPTHEEVERIAEFGRGKLTILDYRLANLAQGQRAHFEWMKFEVELSWPKEEELHNK